MRLGIVPAVISPYVFARIGAGAARRSSSTGERIDAATALRIGLVHEVADDIDAAVERACSTAILAGGPEAVRAAKRLSASSRSRRELTGLAARRRSAAEGQEGLRAFLEKRAASWASE